MEFSGSSSEEHGQSSDSNKKLYHRHTTHQIQQLEAFFKRCAHPDDNQRNQMANEIGLEAKQVKFWFQNKRTQMKTQSEKMNNSSLRAQNERILCENHAIREALKNVLCPACGGPPCGDDEDRQRSLVLLQHQNADLRDEHQRMLNLLSRYIGKPVPEVEKLIAANIPKRNVMPCSPAVGSSSQSAIPQQAHALKEGDNNTSVTMEKAVMRETVESAFDEMLSLLGVDEPLWIKPDGRSSHVLHHVHYENIVMRKTNNNLTRTFATNGRLESSKYSAIVPLAGVHLVDLFLDSRKWADLFHTIVTKAKTIDVLVNGALGSKHGALQLMYGKMHIFSPLIPSREFYFLRSVKHVEEGAWIIVDVSFDCGSKFPTPNCWKFPSGFMIQNLPNGNSKITWVEHVQVDDKGQLHKLYKDIVSNNSSIAFGAERWVRTLQRMCQRYAHAAKSSVFEIGGVRIMSGSYKGVIKLSERMVKGFCEMLGMSGNFDFSQLSEANSSGIRICVRKGYEEGQPFGTIITAATSIWLPLPPHSLFEFFMDDQTRLQWDALSDGRPGHELVHILTGDDPANCISIKRPLIPTQNNMVLLQESCVDPSGSLIAYAPIDFTGLGMAVRSDEEALKVPILPSGVIISTDGRTIHNDRPGSSSAIMSGSLLTLAFQILLTGDNLDVEAVANVNALVSATVQKIKTSLNCPNLD